MGKNAIERLVEFHNYLKSNGYGGRNKFEKAIGKSEGYLSNAVKKKSAIGSDVLLEIRTLFPELNLDWIISGEGQMINNEQDRAKLHVFEMRPRISLNASCGSIALALNSNTSKDFEQIPLVTAFADYDFSVIVKGDSMKPELQAGDEVACLSIADLSLIQWGRYHVLDTAQGIIIKRLYDDGKYISCKSEDEQRYEAFRIRKTDISNIALVVGLVRRY